MNRRRYLAALGITTGLTGCLGLGGNSGSTIRASAACTGNETGGCPPADVADGSAPPSTVDPSSFDTLDRNGTTISLVPIDVAYDWYTARAARFADARGQLSYQRSHVRGAVLSSVETPLGTVENWPTDDFIVTYCGCPHHLSSMRAETLIDAGYENVFALDEGFGEWHEREYPMNGQQVATRPPKRLIRGETAPADAGGDAWAWHDPTGQREAAPIAADGSYELQLHFSDVTDDSSIRVETPSYTVEQPLGDLTSDRVTPADARR
ncbi:rhodanese-like domain-containing protein [Halorientalis brevis]|uniref:Rhodanese-like domain-containing protein n=1 Tax=Halorientalis brevis TaxID=1126241 RepID=A0ABD6C9A4_9EURY|nr:rhodanese-like domain-containing protein [Halorientalis brevis]